MTSYYATIDGLVQTELSGAPMLFKSAQEAATTFADDFDLRKIATLPRFEFGARFALTVADNAGEVFKTFDCKLDDKDGGFTCLDSEFSDSELVYAEIAEQAQCDFFEMGAQSGVWFDPSFECDCDNIGESYVWVINAI
jgi:hypothetical protein